MLQALDVRPAALMLTAFLAAAITGGVFPARRALASIRLRELDINTLMIVAVIGALVLGEWAEAGTVVLLFAIAQWLESRSMERAREAIRALMDLTPVEARIRHGDHEELVPVDRRRPGHGHDRPSRREDSARRHGASPAAPTSIRRRSPVSRCRSTRRPATRSLPARSTVTVRSRLR